jgi:hypothetical protein
MSRRPSPFTEADVKRVIRAAESAGLRIGEVSVDREGRIVIRVREDGKVDGKREWSF